MKIEDKSLNGVKMMVEDLCPIIICFGGFGELPRGRRRIIIIINDC